MAKRNISNLDLKIKLTREYLDNGGYEKIPFNLLLEELGKVKTGVDGKVDPNTVSTVVNSFMLAILGSHLKTPPFSQDMIFEYKSTLQKSNNFVQTNIDTIEDFDKIYDEFKLKTETLFRGQREAKWRLYSKLQRRWIDEKLNETEESYESFLNNLVEIGQAECGAQIKEILQQNHIDTDNPISILGYLQHHGCPTPLLDWTYKFQNALYFALDDLVQSETTIEIDNYCCVYYIDEKDFEGGNLRKIIEQGLLELGKPLLDKAIKLISNGNEKMKLEMKEKFGKRSFFDNQRITGSGLIAHMTRIHHLINIPIIYFSDRDVESGILFSLRNSKNIQNQDGVFTWNSDPAKPIELVGDETYKESLTEDEAENYSFCSCFNINKKLVDHIRKRLGEDGITKDFIYPTPDISTCEIFENAKKEK